MIEYPDSLPLKTLELQHPEYTAIAPTLLKIHDLASGGHQIEAHKHLYLKPRPGEEPELYKLRLEKFTYTNQLGGAIAQQVSKLSSGTLSISGLPDDDQFWSKFREATDGKKRDERSLLSEIFRNGLKFRHVYLHVDKPYSEIRPETKQQEDLLKLNPYVCIYSPLDVINWGGDDNGGELEWIKVRQLSQVASPFSASLTVATWTFIDKTHCAKYSAFVKLGKNGTIVEILNAKGETIDSGSDARVELPRPPVPHNVGGLPVIKFELPEDLYVADQVYLKALEHLNLENSRYDTAMMSGYVQRTWKPHVRPDNDLDNTFVDSEDELQTGNQYVLKGEFEFSEAQGTSITTVSALLQEIRDYIQDAIGMARASASKGAVEQSGISKKMDFVVQELVLRAYGSLLCACYQDLLQLVGRMAGRSPEELASYSVTGLDSFDIDSLESALAIAVELLQVEEKVPPTALKLFYQQLSGLLVKNASAEQQQEINQQLDAIFGGLGQPE